MLDASALLAYLQGEEGADAVEAALLAGSICGAANWSEVAQRILGAGKDWEIVLGLLLSYNIQVEPLTRDDAEWAARRWQRGEGLSLADRLCLALAERVDSEVLTADKAWGEQGRIRQVRSGASRAKSGG
ncbi:PIN domain-containing protein [Candidatus Poriferisocius sp.]|uniref:PIN domain-containing protein n=1 Tax=Candidatus Poriferisocius sp. TaxID=3101276 RepID=UPI003B027D8D